MAQAPRPPTEILQMLVAHPGTSTAFDADAFDELIRAHGVEFVHYRGMLNPVGMTGRFDPRRPDPDHSGSSNGMVYTKAGVLTGVLTSNSKDLKAIEGGVLDAATAQLTVPRFYDCAPGAEPEPIFLHNMDRLYLREESVLVIHQQRVDADETGIDKLRFLAVKVQDVVDANNQRYTAGADFSLVDGRIVWGTRRPEKVYAVRYLYRPFWYIDRMLHDIRVAQAEHPVSGARQTQRMPQSCVVQREYVFEDQHRDEEAPDTAARQARAPRDYSPR